MRVTMIGSGNVATHFAAAFKNAGHKIVQVYSRHPEHAALLAYHVKAEPIDNLEAISTETDIFVIAVSDGQIDLMASVLSTYHKTMVHTSGATALATLTKYSELSGVFYPLQTLSKNREVDFLTVPICIEGYNETVTKQLLDLAQSVSNKVYLVNSEQRKILHLAAVFACNFPNYLYWVAEQLLKQNNLDFDIIRPLILETAQKVQQLLPNEAQTGPAARNDTVTMEAHLQLLAANPVLENIYKLISQEIIKNQEAKHILG